MSYKNRKHSTLIIILIIGVILGSFIGDLFSDSVDILSKNYSIGMKSPLKLDLKVLDLTLGFNITINLASVIGFILALLIYKKI